MDKNAFETRYIYAKIETNLINKEKTMKKEFEVPTCEIVEFDNEDVITTSNELPDAPVIH